MFSLKTSKTYQSPRTKVAEVDLEGLVCTSVYKLVQVDEHRNVNREEGGERGSALYFEY